MSDDSLDVLHHGLAVVVLDVVVAQPHPQVLDVVLAHAEIEIVGIQNKFKRVESFVKDISLHPTLQVSSGQKLTQTWLP